MGFKMRDRYLHTALKAAHLRPETRKTDQRSHLVTFRMSQCWREGVTSRFLTLLPGLGNNSTWFACGH